MGDRDALRASGGSGRVNDIGEPVGHDAHVGRRLRLCRERGRHDRVVHLDHADPSCGQVVDDLHITEQQRHPGVGQQVGDAVGGQLGINRQVGRPRLPDAEDRRHHLGAPPQADSDHRLGSDARTAQIVRQPAGPRVQLPVGDLDAAAHDGDGLRGTGNLLREALEQRTGRRLALRPVPLLQDQSTLGRVEQFELRDAGVRFVGDRRQHPRESGCDPFGHGPVEQVRRCLQDSVDSGGRAVSGEHLANHHVQVELRAAPTGRQHVDSHAWQLEHRSQVLHRQDDLEQRVPAQ